jgi:hypothetical protein
MRTLVVLVCSLTAMSANADVATVGSVKGWEIERGEVDCSATTEFEDGTSLALGIAKSADWSSLILWNEDWDAIEKDHIYSIKLSFDIGGEESFSGKGMKTDISGGIFIRFDKFGVLPAFMASKRVFVWNGENFIGRFNLDGSNAALSAVARCAGASRFERKTDPFAN